LLLLILTVVSWYFRPADRKIISVTSINEKSISKNTHSKVRGVPSGN